MEMDERKLLVNVDEVVERTDQDIFGLGTILKSIGDEKENNVPYTRLQSKIDEKSPAATVFLLPNIEGGTNIFQSIASRLKAHVICMQYMWNGRTAAVEDIVGSLISYIKEHVTKDEPFIFVAYSYGTLIALEAVHILESHGYFGSIICIEGGPQIIKEIQNMQMDTKQSFETAIICRMISFAVSPSVVFKNRENILNCGSWEERLELGFEIVKRQVKIETTYYKMVANAVFHRLKALKDYNPSYESLKCEAILFTSQRSARQDVDDYGLSQIFKNPVQIIHIEGDQSLVMESEMLIDKICSDICMHI